MHSNSCHYLSHCFLQSLLLSHSFGQSRFVFFPFFWLVGLCLTGLRWVVVVDDGVLTNGSVQDF